MSNLSTFQTYENLWIKGLQKPDKSGSQTLTLISVQGDGNWGWYPHVQMSSTSEKAVSEMKKKSHIDQVKFVYLLNIVYRNFADLQ